MPLICKDQTNANPIRFAPEVPPTYLETTPKKPVAAIVTTENRSVTMFIHLLQMF
jgi:hypothetical protein